MNLLKSEIRECIRPLRRLITPDYRKKASLAAAKHFIESPFFQASKRLACYLALPDELDTLPIIHALWEAKKECYLPIVPAGQDKELRFALYNEETPLGLNRYKVLEPQNFTQELSGSQLEVVVLPLLAFDKSGNRLGTGGGYYDRTFSFMLNKALPENKQPHLLGLAYELQQVEKIPQEDLDVPLEGVITEEGMIVF